MLKRILIQRRVHGVEFPKNATILHKEAGWSIIAYIGDDYVTLDYIVGKFTVDFSWCDQLVYDGKNPIHAKAKFYAGVEEMTSTTRLSTTDN